MNGKKIKTIVDTFNFFQFFGWSLILNLFILLCLASSFSLVEQEVIIKIERTMFLILKVTQSLQTFEFFMAITGIGGPSIFSSLAQICSRLIVLFIFINPKESLLNLGLILIPWSISDSVRALFYIKHDSEILRTMRYNFFLILYPMGLTGEILMMEKFSLYDRVLNIDIIYFKKIIQLCFALGFITLYYHMIKQRKKYYLRENIVVKNEKLD